MNPRSGASPEHIHGGGDGRSHDKSLPTSPFTDVDIFVSLIGGGSDYIIIEKMYYQSDNNNKMKIEKGE